MQRQLSPGRRSNAEVKAVSASRCGGVGEDSEETLNNLSLGYSACGGGIFITFVVIVLSAFNPIKQS